jgi:hypothetical protein
MLLLLSATGLSSLGCNSDLGIDEQTYECTTTSDCGDGLVCFTGQCAESALLEARCDTYCADYGSRCNESVGGLVHTFSDRDECMEVCETYPINGVEGATGGNSVQCRLYHLQAARGAVSSQRTHCPHASPSGAGVCGRTSESCLSFCFLLMQHCTGDNRQFETPQNCLNACNKDYQTVGGRFVCRDTHASNAAEGVELEFSCDNAASEEPVCPAN